MEHTPGPWRQVKHTVWAGRPNTTNGPIAEVSGRTIDEGEANARLITAAPEMESLLTELIDETLSPDVIRILQPWFDRVDTVLAALEGN